MDNVEELIIEYIKLIPYGKVTSLSEIERIMGENGLIKKISNLVNEKKDLVNWHRVVKSDGELIKRNKRKQKHLLLSEGVVCEKNKVDLNIYGFYFW